MLSARPLAGTTPTPVPTREVWTCVCGRVLAIIEGDMASIPVGRRRHALTPLPIIRDCRCGRRSEWPMGGRRLDAGDHFA